MRSISANDKIYAFIASSIIGGLLTTAVLVLSLPEDVPGQPLSVLNYDNIDLSKGEIILRNSPFVPGVALQDSPVIPVLPEQELIDEATGRLVVLGVIPPDVAIIKKGDTMLTARVGEETAHGTIDYVTRSGVSINGRFINLK